MASAVGLVDYGGDSEVQQDGRCVSHYFQKYLVRTDSPILLTPQQIAALVGITRGAPLDYDTNATCYRASVSLGPTMTRPPHMAYYVTFEFATNAPKPQEDSDDPTTVRTKWRIAPNFQSRYIVKDRHGNLIVNTAGQPFDGGIPVDVKLGTVIATRNVSAMGYDVNAVLTYSGRWNSAPFLGAPIGTVQVTIEAEEVFEGGYHYWHETYTFRYDPQGIQPKVASAGYFQRSEDNEDELVRIINRDLGDTNDPDSPVQEPEPLDAEGFLVPIDERPDDVAFVEIDYYESIDMEIFGLGTPGA